MTAPDEIDGNVDEERLAELLDRYVCALEKGESPPVEQWLADCPELASVLPDYLEGVQAIHGALAGPLTATPPDAERDDSADPAAPRMLGDYRLLREIGRGGMGVVYAAHQVSLNRRVAVKVLPFAAVLDQRQIARFRTEAQAAASLHHPNIVPVYAVGEERGVHYYAMQHVDGQSLGEVLSELRSNQSDKPSADDTGGRAGPDATTIALRRGGEVSTAHLSAAPSIRTPAYFRAVAQLGLQAAEALEHAHQYGVVHRDIKPTNLLVDRDAKLWVTDFGLARIQTDAGVTKSGDVIGTLRYMSPEQATGRGDLVDGRTDVYGLGATLYEALTLTPAHAGDDANAITRRIEATDPTPPRRINPATPVDLETIVCRAMEKSRDDRYATAAELADDLRRFLDGKPTFARRPNAIDRAGRWIARRRGAALGVAAALAAIAVVSIGSAFWVAAALKQSQASATLAQTHYRQARAAVDHFGGDLADRLAELPGAETLRRELLADTLAYYKQFLATAERDADLRSDIAATHFKSGAIALRLGDVANARASYQKAVDAWRMEDASPQTLLALGLRSLARVESTLGRHDEAIKHGEEAVSLSRQDLLQQPGDAELASGLADSLASYAAVLKAAGDPVGGIAQLRLAVQQYRQTLDADSKRVADQRSLAVALSNLSNSLRRESPDEARECSRQSIAMLEQLIAGGGGPALRADLAMAWNNLAALDGADGNWEQAAEGYRRAAEQSGRLVKQNPILPRTRRELAIARSNLALALARLGEHEASDQEFAAAAAILQRLAEDFPDQPAYPASLAALENNRGIALEAAGRHADALAAFEHAVAGYRQSGPAGSVANKTYDNYVAALRRAGRYDEAAAVEAARQQPTDQQPTERPTQPD
ncbi:MAG: protein kinase [Planctomycetota bacterium]